MILGGHDHFYKSYIVNDILLLKSGTDFREFSVINIEFLTSYQIDDIRNNKMIDYDPNNIRKNSFYLDVKRIEVNSSWQPDPNLAIIVEHYVNEYEKSLSHVFF